MSKNLIILSIIIILISIACNPHQEVNLMDKDGFVELGEVRI